MKTGGTLNDLAVELHRQLATRVDYVADTRRMGFTYEAATDPFYVLTIDDADGVGELGDFPVNQHAHEQIGAHLAIPRKFYERLQASHPDLLENNVVSLFQREPARRMVRTLDGNARAFLSDVYRRLDNFELLDRAVLPALAENGDGMQVFSCGLTDRRLYLKVVFPELRLTVKDGDELSPGIAISNSETGEGGLNVEPFVYRWLCTNGMIVGLQYADGFGMRRRHVGRRIEESDVAAGIYRDETMRLDDEAFFAMAHDLVRSAGNAIRFEAIVSRMRTATETEVPGDPVAAVEVLAQRHAFTELEKGSVMRHLIQGGDLTAWGYVNAITRTAEDVESYDRATELERLGGVLLEQPAKAWATLAPEPVAA